jgi:glycosyltransferase involved in cell wall biosynthesis
MNICKVWDAEYPWDVRAEKVAKALTERGHKVHMVARNRDGRLLQETLPEATIHRLSPLPWVGRQLNDISMFPAFFNPRWGQHILETARATQAQVVLCRDLPLAPTAIWAARRLNLPVVLDMAENYPAMIRAVWESDRHRWWDWLVRNPAAVSWVEQWTLLRVQHILAVVEESRDRLVSLGYPREQVTIVSNTPPLARVAATATRSQGPRSENRPLHLVYLGLLEVPRGIGVLLGAVSQARQKGIPIQLSIIGTGRDEEIFKRQGRTLGLDQGAVRFYGFVPHDAALGLVAEADVGVIPHYADESWDTTIPNKLFDYMAAGLPVLTSNAKPCERIVTTSGCGDVFRDRDEGDCVQAIQRLADPEVRGRMAAAGRAAVTNQYNWDLDSERLDTALRALVHPAGAQALAPAPAEASVTLRA